MGFIEEGEYRRLKEKVLLAQVRTEILGQELQEVQEAYSALVCTFALEVSHRSVPSSIPLDSSSMATHPPTDSSSAQASDIASEAAEDQGVEGPRGDCDAPSFWGHLSFADLPSAAVLLPAAAAARARPRLQARRERHGEAAPEQLQHAEGDDRPPRDRDEGAAVAVEQLGGEAGAGADAAGRPPARRV